jgi:hypothetical protein
LWQLAALDLAKVNVIINVNNDVLMGRNVPEKHFLKICVGLLGSTNLCLNSLVSQTIAQKFIPRELYKSQIIFMMGSSRKG